MPLLKKLPPPMKELVESLPKGDAAIELKRYANWLIEQSTPRQSKELT